MHVRSLLSLSLFALFHVSLHANADDQASQATGATGQVPAAPCSHPRYHEFDFWLGSWDVFGAKDQLVGRSSITRTLGDCVIHEHWHNANGSVEGKSFNLFDGLTKTWRQYWVDNSGGTLILEGAFSDGKMVLVGTRPNLQSGAPQQQRITWTPNTDGSVRQLWETSDDAGKSWQQAFDGLYRPKGD